MKFLLTNDDGIEAQGLVTMSRAVEALGKYVVVAPDQHLSGCSHQATTSRGMQLQEVAPGWHMLDGAPVDCTRIGLWQVAPNVQWVLSGVNEGGNLGADVFLSGTVAAAREACLLGKPAIAVSQYVRRRPIDWDVTMRWTRHVLERLLEMPPQPETENAGQPDAPECVFCQVDPHPLPVNYELRDGKLHYKARYHDRKRTAGYDVEVCFSGRIAISQIGLHSVPPGFAAADR